MNTPWVATGKMNEHEIRECLHEVIASTIKELTIDHKDSITFRRIEKIGADLARSCSTVKSVAVVAIGKAAVPLSKIVLGSLDRPVDQLVIASPYDELMDGPNVKRFRGGHPVPNRASLAAADCTISMLEQLDEDCLVVFLLTGGGSSCFEKFLDEAVSLTDIQRFNRLLVNCGADITEINCVRKHLSAVKGGRLAEIASPAKQVSILVSDCPPEHDAMVASGPTMPDHSTVPDVLRVVEKYDLLSKFPRSIAGCLDSLIETPDVSSRVFDNSSWHCVLSNQDALATVKRLCEANSWTCLIDNAVDEQPIEIAAAYLIDRAAKLRKEHDCPVCVIAGGEVRIEVQGDGVGGRNQAFVLECMGKISEKNMAVVSLGTDGIDGNSRAAGAIATGSSLPRSHQSGLDPGDVQRTFNSNALFKVLGDEIVTGPTGNNVRDVRVIVAW